MIQAELYSDGGGTKDSSAGAGAIIRINGEEKRLVGFLGGATNNEAEIFAALMGFAYLYGIKQELEEKIAVRWVADSEYLLKSATSYIFGWLKNGWKTSQRKEVKNQGMWKAYLAFTKGMSIKPEHVYGHSGHPENEACDSASTWARANGEIASQDLALNIDIGKSSFPANWHFVDGRSYLNFLRDKGSGKESGELLSLAEIIKGKPISPVSDSEELEVKQISLFDTLEGPKHRENHSEVEKAINTLKKVLNLTTKDKKLLALQKDLKSLVAKYG